MAKNKKSSGNNPYRQPEPAKKSKAGLIVAIVLVLAVIVAAVLLFGGKKTPAGDVTTDYTAEYYADIAIEDYGTITVGLDADAAPLTVENFVSLAQSGFYDGLTFHRIMEGFMMQGGDPNGNGTGGTEPITGEFRSNGVENPLSHVRGAISLARAQDPDSGSCQFFIVHADSTFLDGQYACFGYVTQGMEIVDAICSEAEPTDNNGTIPADAQPVITSITIRPA